MRILLLALVLGVPLVIPLGVARAEPPPSVAAIQQRLAPFQALTGRFEQKKRIRVLSRPLVSSGDFVLLKDRGLVWRTTSPIQSGVRITPQGIAQLQDGKATVLVSAKEQPGMSAVGKVLFAVFSLDLARLQEHFQVRSATAPAGEPWTAVLTPKDPGVAKFVREIALEGGRTVDRIELTEANGDVTSLRFTDLQVSSTVTPAQKALLE